MKHSIIALPQPDSIDPDHAALRAAGAPGVALCTVVGIDGSFSRRRGAQIAVCPDGSVVGDLADTCLERQLASDARGVSGPQLFRYGKGSPIIDFRLPCGSGLDILVDPSPDRAAIRCAATRLTDRNPATLPLPDNPLLADRRYVPSLRILAIGEGTELDHLTKVGVAAGIEIETIKKNGMSLGQPPALPVPDRWTAVVLLFHDHEWEAPLLAHILQSEAFYIGAQGGKIANLRRTDRLLRDGFSDAQRSRVKSPVGQASGSRTPQSLALSILCEVTSLYEALHPHG